MVSRLEENCRYTLHDNRFTMRPLNGVAEHRTLTTAKALRCVLTREFRLTLPNHPDLETVLQRLAESGD